MHLHIRAHQLITTHFKRWEGVTKYDTVRQEDEGWLAHCDITFQKQFGKHLLANFLFKKKYFLGM